MDIKTREVGDVLVAVIEGGILQENVDDFQNKLHSMCDKGWTKVVLDMEQCNYITSMCLAVISNAKKKFIAANGDIKIANVNRLIKNLFDITNLKKKIEILDSVENAVKSF